MRKILLGFVLILFSISVQAQHKGDPPAVKEFVVNGFPMGRTDLIKRIVSSDSLMVFKQLGKENGSDKYLGVDNYNSTVELLANSDVLISAKYTFAFNTDKAINKLQYNRLSFFVFTIGGKECLDWFYDQSANFVKDPFQGFIVDKDFHSNINVVMSNQPREKALAVSFKEKH